MGCTILASVLPLKSSSMGRFLNKNMPGITVPEPLIEEMGNASDRVKTGAGICARIIQEIKGLCQGVDLVLPDGKKSAGDLGCGEVVNVLKSKTRHT